MKTINRCTCGKIPNLFLPTLSKNQLRTDPKKVPGKFYSSIECECGLSLDGPDFDSNGEKVIFQWNNIFKIVPIHIKEKPWEQDGWCDSDGKCWFGVGSSTWVYCVPEEYDFLYSYSLPYYSIPKPTKNDNN